MPFKQGGQARYDQDAPTALIQRLSFRKLEQLRLPGKLFTGDVSPVFAPDPRHAIGAVRFAGLAAACGCPGRRAKPAAQQPLRTPFARRQFRRRTGIEPAPA